MGTGWYRQPYYPPEIDRAPVEALAARMIGELTHGVDGTGIRAGIIGEIGAHLGYLTAQEERVLRAAARAQRATGAPLSTHASMYPVGLAHYLDADYHRAILAAGAWVQLDTIGRTHINPDARRADAVVALLRAGWGERLLLSSDRCYRSDLHAFGGAGYDVVFTRFFDLLRARGVSDGELDQMTVTNPQRVLAW
jgi:phosphotriesterase-related protein